MEIGRCMVLSQLLETGREIFVHISYLILNSAGLTATSTSTSPQILTTTTLCYTVLRYNGTHVNVERWIIKDFAQYDTWQILHLYHQKWYKMTCIKQTTCIITIGTVWKFSTRTRVKSKGIQYERTQHGQRNKCQNVRGVYSIFWTIEYDRCQLWNVYNKYFSVLWMPRRKAASMMGLFDSPVQNVVSWYFCKVVNRGLVSNIDASPPIILWYQTLLHMQWVDMRMMGRLSGCSNQELEMTHVLPPAL